MGLARAHQALLAAVLTLSCLRGDVLSARIDMSDVITGAGPLAEQTEPATKKGVEAPLSRPAC